MKNIVHVIPHTHWDYEWYFTVNESLIQLVYHMDEVLDSLENNIIDSYLLDGQLSIIEDYLRVCPENKDRVEKLISSGKLLVGPWYTQTDEMIIRGESVVRNLNLGMDIGEKLGEVMKIGYLPDSFGQGIDMPKIYNGMGIYKSVFWRGLSKDKCSDRIFNWSSEDGSEVKVVNIKDGYFSGVELVEGSTMENKESAYEFTKIIAKDNNSTHVALPVGGDQRYVDLNLKDRIEKANELLEDKGYLFKESNYNKYFNDLENENCELKEIKGELLCSEVSKIHRSIYSSRYDHKLFNDKIERRLIYEIEPLLVMAEQFGMKYKKNLVDEVWKIIIKNHAHDSAGGCNSDKTNKIILDRFEKANELSYTIIDYVTRKISESIKGIEKNDVVLFNTLPFSRNKAVDINISTKSKYFKIFCDGKELEYQTNSVTKEYLGQIKRTKEEYEKDKYYYVTNVSFQTKMDPCSYKLIKVIESEDIETNNKAKEENFIENEKYLITLEDGKISIKDKESGEIYEDCIAIEDGGDEGDTYDYSPAYNNKIYNLNFKDSVALCNKGKYKSTLTLEGSYELPYSLKETEKGEALTKLKYKLDLVLRKESKTIEFSMEVLNNVLDHRMRFIFNSKIKSKYSYSDTPFGYIKRETFDENINTWKEKGWKEEPTPIYPMLSWVNLHNEDKSVTLYSKGIKEYEIVGEDYDKIAITLFRSVGYLGRPDLIRRPGVASGNQFKYIETPDSELLGKLSFNFGIEISSNFEEANINKNYQKYATALSYYQIQDLNKFTSTIKYFVSNSLSKDISFDGSIISLDKCKDIVFSCLKKSKDHKGYILRVYNSKDSYIKDSGEVILTKKLDSLKLVNLKEDTIKDLDTKEFILGEFKPKEIKTFKFNFK